MGQALEICEKRGATLVAVHEIAVKAVRGVEGCGR